MSAPKEQISEIAKERVSDSLKIKSQKVRNRNGQYVF